MLPMESIKNLFRKKQHKYQDESLNSHNGRTSIRQTSFRYPPNPYSVITEPKTKKATRSLPGVRVNASSRHHNTMYENLNNNEFQRQKRYAQQIMRQKPIEEVDEIQHQILMQNNFHQIQQRTSEYGSADPSPTNPFSRNNDHSFDSSDSEAEDSIEAYYRHLFEKNLRKIERKYRRADRDAKNAEQRYYELLFAYEKVESQNNQLKSLLEKYRNENKMLHLHVEELEKKQQIQDEPVVYGGGAPEAMCSISEIGPNYPSKHAYHHGQDDNEPDEIKIFPPNNDEFELPRSASNSLQSCRLNNEEFGAPNIKLELEDPYGKLIEADKHLVHFQHDNSDEGETPTKADPVASPHYTEPLLQIKRSFSDSDLHGLRMVTDNFQEERMSPQKQSRNRLKKVSTRYAKADHSSSYSSDDDRVREVIETMNKQLKPHGEIVHYRPPRKTILNKGTNIYRRCGPNERKAIAEFDYLNDLSTNSSGLD